MNVRLVSGIACVTVGVILLLLSSGVLLKFESVFRWILGRKVVLSSSSQGFPIWTNVSDHYDTRFAWYFFNLTNPEEFKNGGTPILNEVGPFWYKANLRKKNIVFHSNSSVSFEEHRAFEFDPVNSVLPESTRLTMVNVPLMAALAKYEKLGYFARLTLGGTLSNIEQASYAIANYSISQLTYEGEPNTLAALSNAKEGLGSLISALTDSSSKKGRFGFGVDKNMTNPGIFNMYTGATGVQDLNRIHSVNGEHVLGIWPKVSDTDNSCNIVDGTFGNLRPPMRETNEQRIYVPDMCHTVMTRYQKDIEWNHLRLRRFNLTMENFQSAEENPKNICYNDIFKQPSGVTEVGPCKKDAPILMSMPHFMYADKIFSEKVTGMKPDPEKHEFIMDHEPTTGTTVRVRGRVQANLYIKSSDFNSEVENLPELLLPLFWQEMYVEAGPGVVEFLTKVTKYPGLGKIGMTIAALFGLIIAVIGAGLLITSSRNKRKGKLDTNQKVAYTKAETAEPRVDI